MKRITFVLSLVIILTGYSKKAAAQYYFYNDKYYDSPLLFEIGGSIGVMNCLTDLGGKKGIGKKFIKDLNLGKTNLAGGLYFTAMYKYAIGLRLEGTFGKVSAITEFSLVTELHPLFIFIDWTERDEDPPRISPYLLGGIGYYSFNPQAKLGKQLLCCHKGFYL